ncbi:MAG: VOC family protein [Terrimicrobiaceae bacterium]|nr:VOC family protein [Terrimicrobiaceae bacterium]
MPRIFDHIDLRVPDLAAARKFYDRLLPALGFPEWMDVPGGWISYNAPGEGPTEFFGFIESPNFAPNENRIAFWAESNAALDALIPLLREAGARKIEGPGYDEGPGYYAVFFEDPFGNRLEICHRERN